MDFEQTAVSDTYAVDPYAGFLTGQPAPAMPAQNLAPNILRAEGTAQNPRSSAVGPGQFINSTWLDMIGRYRPDLAAGKTPDQILSMRSDPNYANVAKAMTNTYAAENSEKLSKAGFEANPGNVYLAHFAGPQGALNVLKADPNTPVAQVLSQDAIKANPQIAGMTAGQLQQWASSTVSGQRPEGFYGGRMHVTISKGADSGGQSQADPYAVFVRGPDRGNQNQIGGPSAAAMGALQGLTGNFFDELQGAKAASGLPDWLSPFQAPVGAARLAYEHLTGQKGEASKAYDEAVQKIREYDQQAQQQHPYAYGAGNVGGALTTALLPVGAVAQGASMPARIAAGAATGAGYGALYGAGEGVGLEDRATRAASGAVVGGVAGAAAPPVISAVGKGAGLVSDYTGKVLGHPIDTYRAFKNTDQEAARRIGTAIVGDMNAGRAGMSASDLAAARASGQPTSVIDVGGEGTRALARSATNLSPHAQSALEDMTQDRFKGQTQRAVQFVRNLSPFGGNAVKTQDDLLAAAERANKPRYDRVMSANPVVNVPGDITSRPVIQQAMRDAVSLAKNRGEKITGEPELRTILAGDGFHIAEEVANPGKESLRYWDYVKKALDARINGIKRSGGISDLDSKQKADLGGLLDAKRALVEHLDKTAPGYQEARAGAAQFFGAENALEAGQKFVSMSGDINEARKAVMKMSGPERALFAEGFVSELANKISKISDNRSLTIDRIFNSIDGRARIGMAIGPSKAGELEMFLRRENMMDMARKALGNSTTARQWAQMGLASTFGAGAEAGLTGNMDAKTLLTGALAGATVAGHRAINVKLAQRIGEMLASDDPKVLRSALQMAVSNPKVGTAIRKAEGIVERLSGQKAGNSAPMLPAVEAGRADQQQQ